MENMLKTLVIITLVFYLIKGLLYLVIWQATHKIQERAFEEKKKAREKINLGKSLWDKKDNKED